MSCDLVTNLRLKNTNYQGITGSLNVAKLKVFGLPVYSASEVADAAESTTNTIYYYRDSEKNSRILIIRHRRIVGAMGIGPWIEFERIQESIRNKRHIWPWQLISFKSTCAVWSEADSFDVSSWSASAIVCSCKGINRGEISACISLGCKNVDSVTANTGEQFRDTHRVLVAGSFVNFLRYEEW